MEVSIYKNIFDNAGASGNLFSFFTTDKWKNLSDKVRNEEDKSVRDELKKHLPACTPSGLFSERKKNKLIKHSGYICIDIDGQDNTRINFESFYKELGNIKEVAFAGLSVSGKGAFALIPISNPKEHETHFRAIEEDFLRYGVIVDHACKDVSRLRLYSHNATPHLNNDAVIYSRLFKEKPIRNNYFSNESDVETLVNKIVATHTNIVPDYNSWFQVGASLANVRNGRDLFHAISKIDASKYNPKECDKQFNQVKAGKGISINTFFHYSKINGITLKQ